MANALVQKELHGDRECWKQVHHERLNSWLDLVCTRYLD